MMWSEKYRNKDIENFFGNEKSRILVFNWLRQWIKGTKPLLIIGPPGSGKTSYVKSVAHFLNYDLVELNASDLRNKINLEEIIQPLTYNLGIFGKKILLFLDEIDGISGREDFGGLSFLTSILKDPQIPIIMVANSKNLKIKELLKNSKLVEFFPLTSFSSFLLLQYVLYNENKKLGMEEKIELIRKSNGDARSLLNSLQLKLEGDYISTESVSDSLTMEDCINYFFNAKDIAEAKEILTNAEIHYSSPKYGYSQEERNKDLLNAIFSSIIANEKNIKSEDKAEMLDKLSKIDLFINNIYKNRSWHLLKYANDLLLFQLFEVTRTNNVLRYSQYTIPFPLIGSIFIRGQSLKPLRNCLSNIFHVSSSEVGLFYFSYFITILKSLSIKYVNLDSNDDEKLNELITKERMKLKY